VARVLEQQYAVRLEEHAAELAEHFAQSSDPGDLAKAVRYAELAAQRATAVFAYGEAVHHLEQALLAQEVLDPNDQAKRCNLLLALAEALGPAGEPQRVFDDVAEQALPLAEALGDGPRCAHTCLLAFEALDRWAWQGGAWRAAAFPRWLDRLDHHAAPGTRARVEADILRAATQIRAGHWSEGRNLEARALATARELGDAETLFRLAPRLMNGRQWAARAWAELVDLAGELADHPRDGISHHALSEFLLAGPDLLLTAGERDRWEAHLVEHELLAADLHDEGLRILDPADKAYRARIDGRLADAVIGTERMVALGDELGTLRGRIAAGTMAFWPLLWLGRAHDYAIAFPDRLESDVGKMELWLAHQGRFEEARARLRRSLDNFEVSGEAPAQPMAYFLETAVLVGDQDAAWALASALNSVPAVTSPMSAVTRHLGSAARIRGDRSAARAHYEQALAWATRIRFRPEVALTRLEMAELLLEGSAEEQAEAQGHLDFAIEEFGAMKMQPALERALRHKGLLHA
jgi:hypothetical protein